MLSAYAFLTLSWPLSGSAGSKADVDKRLDLVTLPDTCALFAFFVFFYVEFGCLSVEQALAPPHPNVLHTSCFIYLYHLLSFQRHLGCDPRGLNDSCTH